MLRKVRNTKDVIGVVQAPRIDLPTAKQSLWTDLTSAPRSRNQGKSKHSSQNILSGSDGNTTAPPHVGTPSNAEHNKVEILIGLQTNRSSQDLLRDQSNGPATQRSAAGTYIQCSGCFIGDVVRDTECLQTIAQGETDVFSLVDERFHNFSRSGHVSAGGQGCWPAARSPGEGGLNSVLESLGSRDADLCWQAYLVMAAVAFFDRRLGERAAPVPSGPPAAIRIPNNPRALTTAMSD